MTMVRTMPVIALPESGATLDDYAEQGRLSGAWYGEHYIATLKEAVREGVTGDIMVGFSVDVLAHVNVDRRRQLRTVLAQFKPTYSEAKVLIRAQLKAFDDATEEHIGRWRAEAPLGASAPASNKIH